MALPLLIPSLLLLLILTLTHKKVECFALKSAPTVLSFRVGVVGRWQFEELVATFQDFQDWQDLCFIFFHLDTAICNVLFKPQRGDCGKGHYSRPAAWHSTNKRAGAAARRLRRKQ